MLLQPFEQWARDMQRKREESGSGGTLDDRPVYIAHMIGHDVIEIPHRLMQVQAEHKTEGSFHDGVGCSVCRKTSAALPALGSLAFASPSFSMKPTSSRALSGPASPIAYAA